MQNATGLFRIGVHFVNHPFVNSASIGTEEQPTHHDLVSYFRYTHAVN